jgi:serine/threonine protein kinase
MAVPARFLDRYTLERVLAERGAVTTRLMRDGDGALVVVKSLSVRRSTDVRDIELFERETGVLRHLRHPSIPRLVDAGVDDDGQGDVQLHLVQSHVPGKTLEGWITDGRSFTAAEATRIGRDLADVLTTLHGTSPPLVHRDIKPSNVVLDDDGRVFLIDFGAAKRAARDGTAIGTFGYMAPEQLEGRASPRSDVFGVGMTLIHLLTHLHPEAFADDGGVRKAWRARANVPDGLGELLSACVSLDDEQRPADGAALRDRFDALLRPGSVTTTTRATPSTSAASSSPSGLFIAAGLGAMALLLVAGAMAFWLTARQDPVVGPVPSTPWPSIPSIPSPSPSTPSTPLLPRGIPASVRLGAPGIIEVIDCLNRAERALQSEERYRSWRQGDSEPTCRERAIYGLYTLYDDAPMRCREAAAAIVDDSAAAATELADAVAALVPIVAEADRYYGAENYRDDDCADGRRLHGPLLAGYGRVRTAYAAVLDVERALAKSPPPDDEDMAAYRRALDAALVISDPALPPAKRRAAVAAWDEALKACPQSLITIGVSVENLTTWARGSNNIGGTMAHSMVDTATAGAIKMRLIFD